MRTMAMKTMRPVRRTRAAVKATQLKKLRMTLNYNVHVITPHGKVMLGRKGRKV
jgi:hypothetical protein